MKTPEGSFQNRLLENSTSLVPEVGMGATAYLYSDRHAYTVIEVINARTVVVQRDNAIRTDKNGMSDCQQYKYEPNPDGVKRTLTLRKSGAWVEKGDSMKGTKYGLGKRSEHFDFSF